MSQYIPGFGFVPANSPQFMLQPKITPTPRGGVAQRKVEPKMKMMYSLKGLHPKSGTFSPMPKNMRRPSLFMQALENLADK